MKVAVILVALLISPGCGADKAVMMDTKLDAALRQRMTELRDAKTSQVIDILGNAQLQLTDRCAKSS